MKSSTRTDQLGDGSWSCTDTAEGLEDWGHLLSCKAQLTYQLAGALKMNLQKLPGSGLWSTVFSHFMRRLHTWEHFRHGLPFCTSAAFFIGVSSPEVPAASLDRVCQ